MRAFVGLVVLVVALLTGIAARADVCVAADGCHDAVLTTNSLDPETPPPDAKHFVTSAAPASGVTLKNCLAAPAHRVDRFATRIGEAYSRAAISPDTVPQFRAFPLLI